MSTSKRWRCAVCGYVHSGDAPPESCPVCGAPASEFELLDEAPVAVAETPAQAQTVADAWRCMNCNYVAKGDAPPQECPVCGLPRDNFSPEGAGDAVPAAGGEALRIVVVGAGIAGLSAAEAARRANPAVQVTLLGRERHLPYYRLNLTRYLAGEVDARELPIHAEDWFAQQGISLKLGVELRRIDAEARRLECSDGEHLEYDKLILCAGSHPFVPPIPGAQRDCVTSLRTIEDADCILSEVRPQARCVIIGGGILGLEAAGALARQGCQVHMLEGFGYLLPRQLTRRAAELLAAKVAELGIQVHTSAQVTAILGDERVSAVQMADGQEIPADLVVMAAGVRPNSYLARQAGLKVKHGLLVDDHMRTSHPDIFAAGDLAEHAGVLYGIWGPALFQGRIAGMNAAGEEAEFGGIPRSNMLKVLGVDLFSIGVIDGADGSYLQYDLEEGGGYYHLVFRDKQLLGAVVLGDTDLSQRIKAAIEAGEDFSSLLDTRPAPRDVLEALKD